MGIGAAVRRAAGPFEPALANAYRALFFDVADFAARLVGLSQDRGIHTVVEVGCGEGALISELVLRLPEAQFIGIDTAGTVGRLFQGSLPKLTFLQTTAEALAQGKAFSADVVILCDVLHHVPAAARRRVLSSAALLVRPGGCLVVKEWLRKPTPAYWAGWASDRLVTGDRVDYRRRDEWLAEISQAAPHLRLEAEWLLRPWSSNHAFVLRTPA